MKLIRASWPAPAHIHALTTTRLDGISRAPYAELNLADHVGDDPLSVRENREILKQALGLKQEPQWLQQVHGTQLVEARSDVQDVPEADACWTDQSRLACAVLTADCLPVLFTDRTGSRVAAAHAGWRGLAAGVLEQTLSAFENPEDVLVWLGPAIGPLAFEVGDDVHQVFCNQFPEAESAFSVSPTSKDKWLADLYRLATIRLQKAGVSGVFGGEFCTFSGREYFYSYRREGVTGRMASLIWIDSHLS
ncbi:peptidoglycan editing factor PgeF [Nitrincola sp. MINF-07-Sa-05]|uniref:peptidoglycan editing factor PgeF n=1 Tax=Nitrincola salilacus TaxID=3400273 RepID=UPI0039181685